MIVAAVILQGALFNALIRPLKSDWDLKMAKEKRLQKAEKLATNGKAASSIKAASSTERKVHSRSKPGTGLLK